MNRNTRKKKQFFIFIIDTALLFATIPFTLFIRDKAFPAGNILFKHITHFIPIIAVWLLSMYTMKLYNLNKIFTKADGIFAMFFSAFLSLLAGFSVFYLFFSIITPRGFLFLYCFLGFVLMIIWRTLYVIAFVRKKNIPAVLFIGYDEALPELIKAASSPSFFKFEILGVFESDAALKDKITNKIKLLTCKKEFLDFLNEKIPDVIILSNNRQIPSEIKTDLFRLMKYHCQFMSLPDFYEIIMRKIPVGVIHDSWVLSNIDMTSKQYYFFAKRVFDILFSFTMLLITFLPSLIVALAIIIDSKGGIFFKQIREGKNGKLFSILKFRTMSTEGNTYSPTEEMDSRITRVGNFLRKSRIDEIPQFINVLKGDMSFIGPRPERPEIAVELEKAIPFYKQRLLVKPGITGWDQVSGEYHSPSVEDSYKKMQYDLYYIKNSSIFLDLSILAKTISTVFERTGR